MKKFRNVILYALAMMLGVYAAPGTAAPQKVFSLSMSSIATPAGESGTWAQALYTNETPNGNSVINSVILSAPTPAMTITKVLTPQGGTAVVAGDGSSVSVAIMPGINAGGNTWYIWVKVAQAPPGSSCAAYTFGAQAFTGNSFGGTPFTLVPSSHGGSPTLGVETNCILRFVVGRQPNDAMVSPTVITSTKFNEAPANQFVQVELVDTSNVRAIGFDGSTVTLSQSGGTGAGAVLGNTANLSGGVSTFSSLSINAAGTYTLTASISVPGIAASSPSGLFNIVAPTGVLNCAPNAPYKFGNAQAGGQRSTYNKDGSPCVVVNYIFTNAIALSNSVFLTWDTGLQPNAAFSYSATWQPEAVDPSTGMPLTTHRTGVAFTFNPDGSPIWNFGVACTSSQLPTPYGTLKNAIDNSVSTTTVTITAAAGVNLPTGAGVSFPIVMGPPATGSTTLERLQVTAWVSGTAAESTYTVARAQGGTPIAAHAAGAAVMSTPLPFDPNPTLVHGGANPFFGLQVPVCIWDEGWISVGPGMVQFTTSVFDLGDAGLSRSP